MLGPSAAFFQLWPLDAGRPPWSVLTLGLFEHLGPSGSCTRMPRGTLGCLMRLSIWMAQLSGQSPVFSLEDAMQSADSCKYRALLGSAISLPRTLIHYMKAPGLVRS